MGIHVLGMHRSGTSVLARVVGLLVGYQGQRGEGFDNVEGHWEISELNHALESLLRSADADWASPPLTPLRADDPRLDPADLEAVDAIVTGLGEGPWALKDPRACLALDVLLRPRQPAPVVVATFRHPLEVARSIATRDGYQPEYGVALWEVYTRSIVQQVREHDVPAVWVDYDSIIERTPATVERIAGFLSQHGFVVTPEAREEATAAVNPGLRHHERRAADDVLSDEQRRLLALVQEAAAGEDPGHELPPLTPWARALIETRRPFARMERDNRYLVRRLRPLKPVFRLRDRARRALGRPVPEDPFVRYE